MSDAQNVELIRGVYDAFARGDISAVLAAFMPETEWTEAEGFPYAGTYKGPDAILQGVFMRLGTEWDRYKRFPTSSLLRATRSSRLVITAGPTRPLVGASGRPSPISIQ